MASQSASQSVRFMPVSMFGAAMGLCGLALATRSAADLLGVPAALAELWAVTGIIAFALLVLGYLIKIAGHGDAVRAELASPAQFGFFGSVWIATALVAACLARYAPELARSLWWVSVAGILVTQIYALSRWLGGGIDVAQVNTGWMIAFIGPVPIAGPGILFGEFATAGFLFGVSAAATPFIVGLVLYRTVLGPPLPDGMKPTSFVLLVPFALIYAYAPVLWKIEQTASIETLYYFALVLAVALFVFARGAMRWPFTPAWWAFTFPLDAMAIAALTYARAHPYPIAIAAAWLAWAVATLAVLVVALRTLQSLARGTLMVAPKPVAAPGPV